MAITAKMLTDAKVEVEDRDSDLTRQVWRFTVGGSSYGLVSCATRLLLESYDLQGRATTRHKWVSGELGDALYLRQRPDWQVVRRSNGYLRGQDVPLPAEVQQAAFATVAAALTITVVPTKEEVARA